MGHHVPELGQAGPADIQNALQGFLPQNRRVRRMADLLRAAQAGEEGFLLFFAPQKKEYENPGAKFLFQKMERAIASAAKPNRGA